MNIVVCKVGGCPFFVSGGMCKRRITVINQGGHCDQIYNFNGGVRNNWQQTPENYEQILKGFNENKREKERDEQK